MQNILLLVASYIYYAWWDVRFLFLIVVSTVVNYCCGLLIANPQMRMRERITASIWILAACFLFVTVQWQGAQASFEKFVFTRDWLALFSWNGGWIILGVVCIAVMLLNLPHHRIETLSEETRRKAFLITGILSNLGILGFFKYYNFFIDNLESLIRGLHFDPSLLRLNIVLPIGVSFYTFKGISYCVDTYKGRNQSAHLYVDFAAFIAFFPA